MRTILYKRVSTTDQADNGFSLQYQEQGVTFGFGLPLLAQVSLSSLNLGLTLGQRTIATGVWKEQFIGARVSLIMAPSNFEKWFRKRQLD